MSKNHTNPEPAKAAEPVKDEPIKTVEDGAKVQESEPRPEPYETQPAEETPISKSAELADPIPTEKEEVEVHPHDGAVLDQNVKEDQFDVEAEEKAAHLKHHKVSDPVKHAIQNPNGAGIEWPRG